MRETDNGGEGRGHVLCVIVVRPLTMRPRDNEAGGGREVTVIVSI